MSPLRQPLADYLRIRRTLGYKLERAEKLLAQYLDYLDGHEEQRVTIANAIGWATLPAAGGGHWWAFRMSVVRGFAAYLHGLDPAHEVPPADLFPNRVQRAIPSLYSQQEIVALMAATSLLRFPQRQATYRTLVGLLSVTGMRVGEAIRLDRSDVDLGHGVLTCARPSAARRASCRCTRRPWTRCAHTCGSAIAFARHRSATRC